MPGDRDEFVFTSTWYDGLQELDESSKFNSAFWNRILAFRNEANRAIETARNNQVVGGSLEAELNIYVKGDLASDLKLLGDELRFVLITSRSRCLRDAPEGAFKAEGMDCAFTVEKSKAHKCERCWHYESDVDANPEYPGLCKRCIENISTDDGEIRRFA